MNGQFTADAQQQALSFLLSQQTFIEPGIYAKKYADITYARYIPVDTSAPEWTDTITFFSSDKFGQAQWFNANSQDVPFVGTTMEKFQEKIRTAAVGYDYNLEELERARMMGMPLQADRAAAARRAYEEFVEDVAFTGDLKVGLRGLFNAAGVTPQAATGGNWVAGSATGAVVAKDINEALVGVYLGSARAELANTILLPVDEYSYIATTQYSSASDTTILQYILANNSYTAITGQPLTIGMFPQLATAGEGSVTRMIVYRRDADVLKLHIPMPLRFWAAQQNVFRFEVPGMFRLGGVEVKRPAAVRYVDGI